MSDNLYLNGNFAPVADELTDTNLKVTGTIPEELCGRLLRIGPNPVDADPENYHWFLGNGMAHGVHLKDGRANWYRRRYVRDDEVCEKKGWPPVSGPTGMLIANGTVNTNIVGVGDRTFALVEAGSPPVEMTHELETVQRSDFGGTLDGGYTAHPHYDPFTRDLHAVTYSPMWEHLRYTVLGLDGKIHKTVDVPVSARPMVHDCAITENYLLLMDLPVLFDIEMAMSGKGLPYRWFPEHPARVGLLRRDGGPGDVTWHDIDPCYVFHPMNGYEDENGHVVVDVVRHATMFAKDMRGPGDGPPTLDRWTIDPNSSSVREERIHEPGLEFPRFDERRTGRKHRYGYSAALCGTLTFGALNRHDFETGAVESYDEGPDSCFSEAVFVPRTADSAEEDGYLMSYVYNAASNTSDVVILPANDLASGPVARVHLPERVPHGFHGNWVQDVL